MGIFSRLFGKREKARASMNDIYLQARRMNKARNTLSNRRSIERWRRASSHPLPRRLRNYTKR